MLDDVKISLQKFGTPDYLVFVVMLVICSLIGIYFGFIEKKSKKSSEEASDYLVGGRQMKVIPITMSLIARLVESKVQSKNMLRHSQNESKSAQVVSNQINLFANLSPV